jgi:hypothetical protein
MNASLPSGSEKSTTKKSSLWMRLLTLKYMRRGDFYRSKGNNGSQFWKSLHKVKHLFKWGGVHKVGAEKLTQFWNDIWIASSPLRIFFPNLFAICEEKITSVADCAAAEWQINFRRVFGKIEMKEWSELQNMLGGVCITAQEDVVTGGLSASKTFTTSSLYKFITSRGMDSRLLKKIWKCHLPLKINVFLWQAFQNKLQTAVQLKHRKWKGREKCSLCG